MSRAIRATLLSLVVLALLVPAATAAAAPQPWKGVSMLAYEEGSSTTFIISGTLPENTPLPATVEISAPSGAQIMWAGEILGGDLASDPEVKYTVKQGESYDVYTFTLTKSLTGQLEFTIPAVSTFDGANRKVDFKWTASNAVPRVEIRYLIPASATIVTPAEGAQTIAGDDGRNYYARAVENVPAGQTVTLSFVYAPPAAPTGSAQGSGSSVNAPLIAVFALAAAAFALMVIGIRRKMAGAGGESEAAAEPTKKSRTAASKQGSGPASPVAKAEKGGIPPKTIALGVVALVLVGLAIVALNSGRAGVRTGDTIDMVYAQVDTCTTSNIGLTPPAGADLEADSNKVLESLRSVTGVGNATLHLGESRIEVRYCDSQVQESQILAALNGVGYTAAPLGAALEDAQ